MDNITDEEFKNIIKISNTWNEILCKCNYRGHYYKDKVLDRIYRQNLSIEHLREKKRKKYTLDEIMAENSTYLSSNSLKERLIKELNWERKCSRCDLSKWMGKDIPIDLDHINGDFRDNRIENLRFLCPNCHAKTDTYKGQP